MKKDSSSRSKLLWSLVFVAVAAFSVYAIVSQSRSFTLESFGAYIAGASLPWVLCAVLCMLGFILFEGEAVIAICRAFGHEAGHLRGFGYSAADLYFSAITPSATGGQPACAYFMIRDGIPPLVTTVALIANLTMYTASILALGLLTLVTQPGIFLAFGTVSRVLIVAGFLIQALLGLFFLMLLINPGLLRRIANGGLHVLCKLRILRHEEKKREKLAAHMADYEMYAGMIMSHRRALTQAFLLNLLQRISVISVPFFLCLASGGGFLRAARVWAVQCCTVLGSNIIPIPGAMGVSDYMMLDGFADLIPLKDLVDFELFSRAISFYILVLFCGCVTLVNYLLHRKRGR